MASRIVIEEPCEHGETRPCGKAGWSYSDGEVTYRCPGGSRRVLTEGEYVEVQWCERHRSAMHDTRCDYALWKGYDGDPNNCVRIVVWQIDALVGGES